jgi:hypothetical protein
VDSERTYLGGSAKQAPDNTLNLSLRRSAELKRTVNVVLWRIWRNGSSAVGTGCGGRLRERVQEAPEGADGSHDEHR